MNRRRVIGLALARVLCGMVTLAALGVQLAVQVRSGGSLVNYFSFFTVLSNLLAAIVFLVGARGAFDAASRPSPAWDVFRATAVTCMAIVGIVFNVLLRNADLGPLLPWVNVVTHYLMPVLVVADWLVEPPSSRLSIRQLPPMLVFPAIYLFYTLIRGAGTGFYPYPFLDPQKAGGYGGVFLYAAAILAAFLVVGGLAIASGNSFRRARPAPPGDR